MNIILSDFCSNDLNVALFLIKEFPSFFGNCRDSVSDLRIIPDHTKPFLMTCPKRINPFQIEDYVIYLNYKPTCWCQLIYQLAHELGHFYMDCYPEKQEYKWLSEVLCEVFSNVFLEKSIDFFNSFSPGYVDSVKNYLKEHLLESIQFSTINCAEFVSQNINELMSDPTEDGIEGRPRNCYIAALIYKSMENDYKGLKAVRLFPKIAQPTSLEDFFVQWNNLSETDEDRDFILKLQSLLGV